MRRGAALGLLLCTACAADRLDVRLVHAPDDDPFVGADSLVVGLERDGQLLSETVSSSPLADEWSLPSLPYGERLRFVVETRMGDLPLGRGRSFPFDFPEDGAPRGSADVHLGSLGLFGRAAPGGAPVGAIRATDTGAIWVTRDGVVERYVAHDAAGHPRVERVADHGLSMRWLAVRDRGFVGLAGTDVAVVDGDGALLGVTPLDALAAHDVEAAALVPLADAVVVLGGGSAVTRLDVGARGEIVATPLEPLPVSVAAASGCAVELAAGPRVLALVRDGPGPRVDAYLVDPLGRVATVHGQIDAPASGFAMGVLAVGVSAIVAVVGGRSPSGVDGRVITLLVTPDGFELLPAPDELIVPRADARLVEVIEGLLLVAGGVDDLGAPIRRAELIALGGLEDLPGDVVPTGELPTDPVAPAGVALADSSALLVDEGLIAIYTDPRTASGLP